MQPDGYDLLQRVEEIVRRGRIRGFVPWLISQCPAVLHKDVLSQADVLISMKLTSSQDRGAVGRWIEGKADRAEGRRILAALPRLARGEGWVWAPSGGVLAQVAFPGIRTLDSSQTPSRLERATMPCRLPMLDLTAIDSALAGIGASTEEHGDPSLPGRGTAADLEGRLGQQHREVVAARAKVVELEVAIAVPARLDGT